MRTFTNVRMPLQPTPLGLCLLPVVPFLALVAITLTLRPSCHMRGAGSRQNCEAYRFLAFTLDAIILLAILLLAIHFAGRHKVEQDLETQYLGGEADFFVGTERDPLVPQAYTFAWRELPFNRQYGTIGADAETQALLSFYHFPNEEEYGSFHSTAESGHWTTHDSDRPVSPKSLAMSASPFEEEEGWVKWRWRLSKVGYSVSPTATTIIA
jgi:hypothetical protein